MQRFLPGLRAGTTFFSLGYSEPEAGSDLGGVRTRAVRAGGRATCSTARSAGRRVAIAPTTCGCCAGPARPRATAAGLTLLIVDRRSPGITISPIPSLDGERFNEVRFDDVEVPVENRVGEEDGAWTLMVESLATERHVQFSPKRVQRDFEELVALVQRTDATPTRRARDDRRPGGRAGRGRRHCRC